MIDVRDLGFVAGPHGVKGHLKLIFSVQIQGLTKGTWLFLEIQKKPVPFFIQEITGENDNWVVKLKGIDSPEEIKAFQGLRILLSDKYISVDEGEGLKSLVGYEIIDYESGKLLGRISSIFDNSAHLVAQVHAGEKEHLVPLHEDQLIKIIHQDKKITLQIPEGLLDL